MAIILIVDDEQALLDLLENILEDLGHKALKASNGKEALRVAELERPDLIISDVMMPVMDGISFVRNLKSNDLLRNIKVVLISAAPIKDHDIKPDKYMRKPYNLDDMDEMINKLLGSA